jgi:hypothetical protein
MAKTIQHADPPSCVVGALITVELPPAQIGGSVRVPRDERGSHYVVRERPWPESDRLMDLVVVFFVICAIAWLRKGWASAIAR